MRASRLVPILVLFLLLSGGQLLLLADDASAGCCSCTRPGYPLGCYNCGNCYLRAQAFVESIAGAEDTSGFMIETTNSGKIRVDATQDVMQEILDLRQQGKILYGDFAFKVSGNENNLQLKCIGFFPIERKDDQEEKDLAKDPNRKEFKKEFEEHIPKQKKQ